MAELNPQERLQPCLLDRLTDEDPSALQEGRDRRVVSLRQLRQAVLRDLAWLLNSSAHLSEADAAEYPEAARSVINFGMPDLCGLTAAGVEAAVVEKMIREAIRQFEPRILPNSLRVRAGTRQDMAVHNSIYFEIQGDLWALPLPEHLYVRTEVDLETGHCSLQERANG